MPQVDTRARGRKKREDACRCVDRIFFAESKACDAQQVLTHATSVPPTTSHATRTPPTDGYSSASHTAHSTLQPRTLPSHPSQSSLISEMFLNAKPSTYESSPHVFF